MEGLAKMGPAARDALPELDRQVKAGPRATTAPAQRNRETKLVASMREAATKTRGM